MKELFLISSSNYQGGELWAHCLKDLGEFLGEPKPGCNRILFIPFAKADGDYDGYTKLISEPFERLGYEVIGAHVYKEIEDCYFDSSICAIYVGGGNTWLLQNELSKLTYLSAIKEKVSSGIWKYIGDSAGAVMASPSMLTTNDMAPILPSSDRAIGLVPFQINPHFVLKPLVDKHMGETREERIKQVIMQNPDWTIVGLPEGVWIVGRDEEYILYGYGYGRIFREEGDMIWSPGVSFSMLEPL